MGVYPDKRQHRENAYPQQQLIDSESGIAQIAARGGSPQRGVCGSIVGTLWRVPLFLLTIKAVESTAAFFGSLEIKRGTDPSEPSPCRSIQNLYIGKTYFFRHNRQNAQMSDDLESSRSGKAGNGAVGSV